MTKNNGKPLESSDTQRVEELLDMTSFLDSLKGIDLGKLELEKEKALSPQEAMLRDLRANKKVMRYLKSRTPRRKKLHWTQKKRNRLNYLRAVAYPKRAQQRIELMETGEGWYKYLVGGWRHHKIKVEMTEQEWLTEVWPRLEGRLPVIIRYDSTKPISLENIYLLDSDTRDVLFEGADYKLRSLGYIL